MSALSAYARLFRLAGPAYVLVAFLGRLPMAMAQLGTLLLVSTATGTYGLGGLAAGALAVANAVGAPVAGGLADRFGQRPVVLVQSVAGAASLAALTLLAHADAGGAVLVVVAAVTGLALPQVGPLARVRWRPITSGTGPEQRRLVDAAFSYEGAVDEASFAIGPALVGVVAVWLSPAGALVTAAVLLAVFGTAFALHPTARRTATGPHARPTGRLLTGAFAVLVVAQAAVGVLFGATQTGTTVLATQAGQPGLAGLIHAVLGVGSAAAGIGTAFIPAQIGHERRVLAAACALVALSWPLLLVDSLPALTAAVAVLGFAVAPYMIGVFSLGERVVPAGRTGAAMTALASATGVGYALGSSVAGRLADVSGHTAAFAVTVTTTAVALLVAATQQRRLRSAVRAAADAPEPAGDAAAPAVVAG
ncbi:MFS transporter [Cellulomonas pakistanensis]|uniref:MFS transporter n=1 Tax=Cellulomonas pakistanensis TaxID=992287 RepID=A0A919P700_9CELL|nr:MFS transporter [Cellulomonas pakistanensis]GIG35241.1 MFS transporter [Cellulomonas pakistanensis]